MGSTSTKISITDKFRFPLTLESGLTFLVFLFPVFAVSLKSWSSSFHVFIFLLSLVIIAARKWRPGDFSLKADEKIFLGLLVLVYAWYLFSEFMNGWEGVRSHWPWIDFRYLMTIPIYLALKRIPGAHAWLLRGGALGCIVAAAYSGYQVTYQEWTPKIGAYHHLFLGPVSAAFSIMLALSKPHKWNGWLWRIIIYAGIIGGVMALLFSTARSGMLALLAVLVILPLVGSKITWKQFTLVPLSLLIILAALYSLYPPFKNEVADTVKGVTSQWSLAFISRNEFHEQELDNITSRVEMWRTAFIIGTRHLEFGAGRDGYAREVQRMVAEGEGHPWLKREGIALPHSAYLYHFSMRGVTGLALFLLLLAWPAHMFLKAYKNGSTVALQGFSWVIFFAVVALTQSSTFSRGHYLSVFITVLVIMLSTLNQPAKEHETSET